MEPRDGDEGGPQAPQGPPDLDDWGGDAPEELSPTTKQAHDIAIELQVSEGHAWPCVRCPGPIPCTVSTVACVIVQTTLRCAFVMRTAPSRFRSHNVIVCLTRPSQLRLARQHDLHLARTPVRLSRNESGTHVTAPSRTTSQSSPRGASPK